MRSSARVEDPHDPADGLTAKRDGNPCSSPLGWAVWLAYGERNLLGTIFDPHGKPYSSTTCATVLWLESDLP